MAILVEMWEWFSLALMMLVLYSDYSEAFLKSGGTCFWLNYTNFSCEMCDMLEEKILDCHNRSLENVTVIGSDQIVGVNVSHNLLGTTPLIRNCSNLEWIDLSHNRNLRVMNEETFMNIRSESLRILNISNCGLLKVLPVPLEDFLSNLEIFLIANNSLTSLNVSMFQKLKNFRLLDVRNNGLVRESIMPCDLIEQNAIFLVNTLDCKLECVQDFFQCNCNLTYLLPYTSENTKCHCLGTSSWITPTTEYTTEYTTQRTALTMSELSTSRLLSTTDYKESTTAIISSGGKETVECKNLSKGLVMSTSEADYFSFIGSSSTGTADITTEESISTVEDLVIMWKLIIGGSSLIFIALCLLLIHQLKRCLMRKSRQGQYSPWLPGNTPADYALYYSQNISSLLMDASQEDGRGDRRNDRNSQTSAYKVYSQLHFENFEAEQETVFYSNYTETLA